MVDSIYGHAPYTKPVVLHNSIDSTVPPNVTISQYPGKPHYIPSASSSPHDYEYKPYVTSYQNQLQPTINNTYSMQLTESAIRYAQMFNNYDLSSRSDMPPYQPPPHPLYYTPQSESAFMTHQPAGPTIAADLAIDYYRKE